MWDVVVVGARCAGAATALRFARSGRSVLMLDKARLASDTLSTHVLVEPAIAQLRELGLLDAVRATGAPPIHTSLFEFDGKAFPSPNDLYWYHPTNTKRGAARPRSSVAEGNQLRAPAVGCIAPRCIKRHGCLTSITAAQREMPREAHPNLDRRPNV